MLAPIKCNTKLLNAVIESVLLINAGEEIINKSVWEEGRYCPTPTIIEAAMALYNGHAVSEISRSDASAINLSETSAAVTSIINDSKNGHLCLQHGDRQHEGLGLHGLDHAHQRHR